MSNTLPVGTPDIATKRWPREKLVSQQPPCRVFSNLIWLLAWMRSSDSRAKQGWGDGRTCFKVKSQKWEQKGPLQTDPKEPSCWKIEPSGKWSPYPKTTLKNTKRRRWPKNLRGRQKATFHWIGIFFCRKDLLGILNRLCLIASLSYWTLFVDGFFAKLLELLASWLLHATGAYLTKTSPKKEYVPLTPPKTNISPEKRQLEANLFLLKKIVPFEMAYFQVRTGR